MSIEKKIINILYFTLDLYVFFLYLSHHILIVKVLQGFFQGDIILLLWIFLKRRLRIRFCKFTEKTLPKIENDIDTNDITLEKNLKHAYNRLPDNCINNQTCNTLILKIPNIL